MQNVLQSMSQFSHTNACRHLHSTTFSNLSCIFETIKSVGGSSELTSPPFLHFTFSNFQYFTTYIPQMSSEPPPFCISVWIMGNVSQFPNVTNTICYVYATLLRSSLNSGSIINRYSLWNCEHSSLRYPVLTNTMIAYFICIVFFIDPLIIN